MAFTQRQVTRRAIDHPRYSHHGCQLLWNRREAAFSLGRRAALSSGLHHHCWTYSCGCGLVIDCKSSILLQQREEAYSNWSEVYLLVLYKWEYSIPVRASPHVEKNRAFSLGILLSYFAVAYQYLKRSLINQLTAVPAAPSSSPKA